VCNAKNIVNISISKSIHDIYKMDDRNKICWRLLVIVLHSTSSRRSCESITRPTLAHTAQSRCFIDTYCETRRWRVPFNFVPKVRMLRRWKGRQIALLHKHDIKQIIEGSRSLRGCNGARAPFMSTWQHFKLYFFLLITSNYKHVVKWLIRNMF